MLSDIAIYAGSFDPPTFGHLWFIQRVSMYYKKLIVAVGTNSEKTPMFTEAERIDMLKVETADLPNIEVVAYPNVILTDFARSKSVLTLVRGIRSDNDYHYELEMCRHFEKFAPEITMQYYFPPSDLAQISSSFVKSLTKFDNWENKAADCVSENVIRKLQDKFRENSR